MSQAQASDAAVALTGRDTCITGPEVDVTFRTSSMVGSLAEYYLGPELRRSDMRRLGTVLSTLTPLNVSEDFALCVAARNPAAARDLALSEPGSATEAQAGALLGGYVPDCTNPGERLTVDLQSLRALTSTALYRAMSRMNTAAN